MTPLDCPKFTFGVGDRFGRSARAQLAAFEAFAADGPVVVPVWNKSNREHRIIGSEPAATRAAADAAVAAAGWPHGHFCDADHITLATVDRFLLSCDFFTLDVAEDIGRPADPAAIESFVAAHPELCRPVQVPGIARPLALSEARLSTIAAKYLAACQAAGRIHRHLLAGREAAFVTEVSMDETDAPQAPPELLVILAALADEGVPVQTIAPKFTGRFNKGVDYVGDLAAFEREFRDDLAVLAHAVARYGLPAGLKLSVHSGSDKFSLYPIIAAALRETGAGLHLKTAGTSWLEELIGLAESGEDGRQLVLEIYGQALAQREALCQPYATVIDIDPTRLPGADQLAALSGPELAATIRHDPDSPRFNPAVRQLLHVGFKVAAGMGPRYLGALERNREAVAASVTGNLLERHLRPLFG